MKIHRSETPMLYDGRQLKSHFAYEQFGISGDSIVCFEGPCRVELTEMVDREDVLAKAGIVSPRMLHFIVEHFDPVLDLEKAVLRQRLLVCLTDEILRETARQPLQRRGDDLYGPEERKLSVCVATRSLVSSSIHLGLNVQSGGAPVPTIGLEDLGLDPEEVGDRLMTAYCREIAGIQHARSKVAGVP